MLETVALAVPVLVTVICIVKDWFVSTCERLTVGFAAETTAAVWTVTAFVLTGPTDSAAPLFASVPLTVARNVRVPAAAAVYVNVKGTVAPAATVAVAGVTVGTAGVALAPPVAVNDGVTVTPFAAAPPAGAVFVTLTVNSTDSPTLMVAGGCAAKAALSPAAA
jgi:hypothetical protein